MLGALCVTVGFIGLGLLMIFGRDFTWGLQEFSNQTRGIQSERTEVWDSTQVIYGIVVIIAGVVLSLMVLGRNGEEQREISEGTATAAARLAQVQQYGTPIATLQTVGEGAIRRIAAEKLGMETGDVFYGRCENGNFYAYVYDPQYSYKALAYVPDGSLSSCRLDGVYPSQVDPIGGGWYSVWLSDSPDRIMTSVARMAELKTPENVLKMFPSSTPRPRPTSTPEPVSAATAEATA